MPFLARAKRQVAAQLASRALTAEARQTQICTYLSAILLGWLGLNAAFGWRWADPIAALLMVPLIEPIRDEDGLRSYTVQLPPGYRLRFAEGLELIRQRGGRA